MKRKLKGISKLNSVFEQFFVDLGYPEIECSLAPDFAYYYGTDEITYSLFAMPEANEGFKRYLKMTYPKMPKCSMFVFSLLHELGHHITMPKYSEKDFKKWTRAKAKIEKQIPHTSEEKIKRQIIYCGLFDEKIATAEAVKILLMNYDYIHSFEKVWYKAVMDFYKKNNIKNC